MLPLLLKIVLKLDTGENSRGAKTELTNGREKKFETAFWTTFRFIYCFQRRRKKLYV
jgi:hypothetical protein